MGAAILTKDGYVEIPVLIEKKPEEVAKPEEVVTPKEKKQKQEQE